MSMHVWSPVAGSKCDAEFLTAYGFIPPNNSHVPCKPLPGAAGDQ